MCVVIAGAAYVSGLQRSDHERAGSGGHVVSTRVHVSCHTPPAVQP